MNCTTIKYKIAFFNNICEWSKALHLANQVGVEIHLHGIGGEDQSDIKDHNPFIIFRDEDNRGTELFLKNNAARVVNL